MSQPQQAPPERPSFLGGFNMGGINVTNALIRLLTIIVAGVVGYVLWSLVPEPTVKGAAVLLMVAVVMGLEQLIKPQ